MPNLNELNESMPLGGSASASPEYGRIPAAVARFGVSRSRLYLLAASGLVLFIKDGGTTLVDFASVREYLKSLPTAEIRLSRGSAARDPQADQ